MGKIACGGCLGHITPGYLNSQVELHRGAGEEGGEKRQKKMLTENAVTKGS